MLAEWFITLDCNYFCPYCYLPERKPVFNFHLKTEKILEMLEKKGFTEIDILGGEPFLARDSLLKAIKYCKDSNLWLRSVSTNGSIYDQEIVKALQSLDDFILQITLDGATPSTYQIMRNSICFYRVIDNIKHFIREGLNVFLGMTITIKNYREITKFIKLAERVNAKGISIGGFIPVGRGKKVLNWSLNSKKIEWLSEKIKMVNTKLEILGIGDNECPAGNKKWAILPNGDLYPCGLLISFEEARVGNIFKGNNFNTDWMKKFFNFQPPQECQRCSKPSLCYGGCKAALYSFYGFPQKSLKPLCQTKI